MTVTESAPVSFFPGGSLFSAPKPKVQPPAPPIPTPIEETGAGAEARQKERLKSRKRRGRAASILTGASGAAGLGRVKRPGSDGPQALG